MSYYVVKNNYDGTLYYANDGDLLANIINQQNLLNIITKGVSGNNNASVSFPLIYSTNDLKKPLVVQTDDSIYIIRGNYPYLNSDETFISKVIKWTRHRILDDWLYDEMRPLLSFLDIDENGRVHWVTKDKFVESAYLHEGIESMEKKIKFIEDEVLSKKLIKHVVQKFVDYNNLNWYDLKAYKNKLSKVFFEYLKNKFEDKLQSAK